MDKEYLVATVYEYDDGGGKLWPHLLTTLRATLGYVGVHFHRSTAHTTELCCGVPIEQLMAFSGHEIQFVWQFVVRLA